jgi:hypothetical protein
MAGFHGALGLFSNAAHDSGKDVRGAIMGEAFAILDKPSGRTLISTLAAVSA